MAKRRTDNVMAKRRTDNVMAKRRTDNVMAKRRTDKGTNNDLQITTQKTRDQTTHWLKMYLIVHYMKINIALIISEIYRGPSIFLYRLSVLYI